MRRPHRLIPAFFLLTLSSAAYAKPGDLDKEFAQDGRAIFSMVDNATDQGEVIALRRGGLVVAGVVGMPEAADVGLVGLTADGHLDKKFGTDGRVTTDLKGREGVYGLVVDRVGRIVVAGYTKGARRKMFLLRYLPTGRLDATFGTNGKVITDTGGDSEIHFLALQGDGKILAAGFTTSRKKTDILVARYLNDGSLDDTFGNGGWRAYDFTADDRGYGLDIGRNGDIFVTGSVKHARTGADCAVLKVDGKSGEPDAQFGYGGLAVIRLSTRQDVCSSVLALSDGSVVAAGYSQEKRTAADFALIKLLKDGSLDATFGHQGWTTVDFEGGNDVAHALAVDSRGRLIAVGEYQKMARHYYRAETGFAVLRVTNQGFPDVTFGIKGRVTDDFGNEEPALANAMVLQGNTILAAGYATRNFAVFGYLNH